MLKKVFKNKGIKQKWIAEKLGVSEVTVSNWVNSKTVPKDVHLIRLSELLDFQLGEFSVNYKNRT